MLVKKPARSWLTKTKSASTGADFRMDRSVYTSPVAKWFGQATGMSWKIRRARILSIGRTGEVHKGNDGSATSKVFLPFGQNVAWRKLSARSDCPRVGSAMLSLKGVNKWSDYGSGFVWKLFKNGRILEGLFDGLVIKTRAVNVKRGGMFVLAVEDGPIEGSLELSDGGLGDVVCDLLGVFGLEVMTKVRDVRVRHGR